MVTITLGKKGQKGTEYEIPDAVYDYLANVYNEREALREQRDTIQDLISTDARTLIQKVDIMRDALDTYLKFPTSKNIKVVRAAGRDCETYINAVRGVPKIGEQVNLFD